MGLTYKIVLRERDFGFKIRQNKSFWLKDEETQKPENISAV